MPREVESGSARSGSSRDRRRLALGLLFMALFLASTLAAVFLWGGPPASGGVAPGVPLLVASGWVLVAGAAAVFYRTFPGSTGDDVARDEPAGDA